MALKHPQAAKKPPPLKSEEGAVLALSKAQDKIPPGNHQAQRALPGALRDQHADWPEPGDLSSNPPASTADVKPHSPTQGWTASQKAFCPRCATLQASPLCSSSSSSSPQRKSQACLPPSASRESNACYRDALCLFRLSKDTPRGQ